MTQQAVVGLVRNRGLAVGAWSPAPQTSILQYSNTAHVVCRNGSMKGDKRTVKKQSLNKGSGTAQPV